MLAWVGAMHPCAEHGLATADDDRYDRLCSDDSGKAFFMNRYIANTLLSLHV